MNKKKQLELKENLIDYVIDHLKYFKFYPMDFEYEDGKFIYFDEIMEIIKNRKKEGLK